MNNKTLGHKNNFINQLDARHLIDFYTKSLLLLTPSSTQALTLTRTLSKVGSNPCLSRLRKLFSVDVIRAADQQRKESKSRLKVRRFIERVVQSTCYSNYATLPQALYETFATATLTLPYILCTHSSRGSQPIIITRTWKERDFLA